MSQSPRKTTQETGSDWLLPIAAVLFAAYYLYSVRDLAWEAKTSAVVVAAVLLALIAIFMVRSIMDLRSGARHLGLRRLYDNWSVMGQRLLLFGLAVVYVLVIPYAGFTLTTFAFLAISLLTIARMGVGKAIGISALAAFGGWVLFIAALQTDFPLGPFETTMRSLTGF